MTYRQTTVHKTQHRKLKTERQGPKKFRMNVND